jgi:uncharacterized protein YfaS (alpha-2-macroglobulin family)
MSTINEYDKGDSVRCRATFKNSSAALIDPTVVRFKYKDPSGNVATLVYGTDASLVKDSDGHYHVDVDADQSGTWFYRFESTGTGQAADEGTFEVSESHF